ncbi:hypothetical protein AHAS_Ahas11G0096200 [Arachis hypogaea]
MPTRNIHYCSTIFSGSTLTIGGSMSQHLYRALCCASWYDCKNMDSLLNLLFVWAWEQMPCVLRLFRDSTFQRLTYQLLKGNNSYFSCVSYWRCIFD